MKRYSNNDNLNLDPMRLAWNKNNELLQGFNKPINKLQDDIMINNLTLKKHSPPPKKNFDQFNHEDVLIDFLPKDKNKKTMVPFSSHLNVTNYNNEKFRFKNMSQELMDKDEEIQKHKNEVYQLQIELNDIKKEKSKMISADMENKLLKEKLNEHYSISRELTETKHNLKRELIDKKSNLDTIEMLKKIIHKQHVRLSSKEYNASTDEDEGEDTEDEIESDYETDYSSEEEIEEVKEKPPPKKGKGKVVKKVNYGNITLKKALLKQRLPSRKIDEVMVRMKITPTTKITKTLLTTFLKNMKK